MVLAGLEGMNKVPAAVTRKQDTYNQARDQVCGPFWYMDLARSTGVMCTIYCSS